MRKLVSVRDRSSRRRSSPTKVLVMGRKRTFARFGSHDVLLLCRKELTGRNVC